MFKQLIAALFLSAFALPIAASADTNITAAGSTALLPLVKQSAADYQNAHPDVKIAVSGGGSFVGITQAQSGNVDMGDSDVIAPGNSGLVDHKVAVVGFGIIVNPSAGVKNLSAKQVRDIFAGRVSNWKDVGGADQQIVVINRPRTSGTRFVFNAAIMGVSKIADGTQIVDSSGQVVSTVAETPGTISYVALGYARGKAVTLLSVNGIEPSDDNIRSGKYPIWSYEHIFTKGKASPQVQDFINYIMRNTDALGKLGYLPVSVMRVSEANR